MSRITSVSVSHAFSLTSVNNTVRVIQIDEATKHSVGDLANNLYGDGTSVTINVVERSVVSCEHGRSVRWTAWCGRHVDITRCVYVPKVHEFHNNANVHVHGEASVVSDNVWRAAVVHNLQLAKNLLANRRFGVDENKLERGMSIGQHGLTHLLGHDAFALLVPNLCNSAAIASPKIGENVEVLILDEVVIVLLALAITAALFAGRATGRG